MQQGRRVWVAERQRLCRRTPPLLTPLCLLHAAWFAGAINSGLLDTKLAKKVGSRLQLWDGARKWVFYFQPGAQAAGNEDTPPPTPIAPLLCRAGDG